ncbi:2',5'-phosphodiesterase 12-like isoform X2 [Bacillus rossius redtenbacheri]
MFCMNPVFQYLYEEVKKNKNYADAFKSSSGILMCAVLQTGNLSRYVVVGNTHLRSGEENGHIRLMQTMMAVEHLQHIVAKYKQIGPNVEVTPVLCGDLNSLPQSSVLELLETGSLPADCPDWRSKVSEAFEGMPLQHDLRLKSAYTNLAYTNYTTDFKGCVDYIFYNCDDLQLIQTVPIPAESELQAQVALPSLAYPSDHLALVADLGWRRDADASGPSRLQAKLGDLQVAPGRRGAPKPRGRSRGGRGKAAGNT